MQISDDTRKAQERLSGTALEFLQFVEKHPECFERRSFEALEKRTSMKRWAFQPWPAFGNQDLVRDFEQAAVGLLRLARSVPQRLYGNDPRKIAEAYELPGELMASLILEKPNGIAGAPLRGDFIDGPQGLKCVELNCGSNVGGWQMPVFLDAYRNDPLIAEFIREQGITVQCRNTVRLLFSHIVDTVRSDPDFGGGEINLAIPFARTGIYGYSSQPKDEFRQEYAALLESLGMRGELLICQVTDLKDRGGFIYVGEQRAQALLEQQEGLMPDFIFRSFKARRVHLFSGPVTPILSDKRNVALLSELGETELFTPAEQEVIRSYVSWTRLVRPGEVTWNGHTAELPRLLLERRGDLVLKHATSSGGMGIHVGRFTEEKQWAGLVKYALGRRDWIVQEYLPSWPYVFQCDGTRGCEHDAVWGLFAFGESYGGCSVRLQPKAKETIINMSHGATTGILLEV